MGRTKYPEHEKLSALGGSNQVIGEFLEWIRDIKGYRLAEYHRYHTDECEEWCDEDDELVPVHYTIEGLVAEFFEIDRNKLEEEKRQMLEELRNAEESVQ